ncbi:hypothetical protein [Aeromicrobium duanguangcaii]|uniref:Uncharacterized protein n=1 Tax=Aeromicrobium duanguangcaii TaxID=2968086 RepID=A0ABY5KEX6_9ACTN|nr:hypothetical protein [Aeromicrobium duanguangcaii]MCD9154514.1 hypothetical protein [Aeromicrobium duanguangcaii]MCL3838262.1 hypothetical protein [Aeromicrobium duanguangcaii]UUI68430.1 hypothetical protein NP095_14655 [Aeromicrobium duanguangcaii]
MASWWRASNPELVVAPTGAPMIGSVHDRRFVDRELVQPGPSGRLLRKNVAEVLAAVGDVDPMSLYETRVDDVTVIDGPSVHCYFRSEGDVVVESVDPDGWRRFTFVTEPRVMARLVIDFAAIVPGGPGRLVACALAEGSAVLLSDGTNVVLGDLPESHGPAHHTVRLEPEDLQLLLLARLRTPALA